MRILTRYVLLELLKVFVVTLTAMTLLMILVGVAQEAIRQGLGPAPILKLVPYVLPNALRFAVPGTILFAACSVFGRISASQEVTAIKSVGVSPMKLINPALVLAFLLSLAAVWLNDVAVSWGRQGVHRVVVQSVEQIAYGMLRTHRSYSTNRFSINVKRVEGRKLLLPTLTFYSDDSPPVVLTAQEAEMKYDPVDAELKVLLTNGEVDRGEDVHVQFTDTIEYAVPLAAASRKGAIGDSPSELAMRRIPIEIDLERQRIEQLEQMLAAEASYRLISGQFAGLTDNAWRGRAEQLRGARARLHRLETEPWRRWANGFSCFFFVMVGAPFAIKLRSADLWTSFGKCFSLILLCYYPLLAFSVDRAKDGALPPCSVWLGNLICLLVGLLLLRSVERR